MSKIKLTATLPNGEIATRTTARTYTHLVAVLVTKEEQIRDAENSIAWYQERLAKAVEEGDVEAQARWSKDIAGKEAKIANASEHWFAITWCGRPDLAVKAMHQHAKRWSEVAIVEINQPA